MPTHVDCHEIADFAFHAGEAFILIALAMGALIALADVMAPPPKP